MSEGGEAETLQGIEIQRVRRGGVLNVLAYAVVARYYLCPLFQVLVYEVVFCSLGRERIDCPTVGQSYLNGSHCGNGLLIFYLTAVVVDLESLCCEISAPRHCAPTGPRIDIACCLVARLRRVCFGLTCVATVVVGHICAVDVVLLVGILHYGLTCQHEVAVETVRRCRSLFVGIINAADNIMPFEQEVHRLVVLRQRVKLVLIVCVGEIHHVGTDVAEFVGIVAPTLYPFVFVLCIVAVVAKAKLDIKLERYDTTHCQVGL